MSYVILTGYTSISAVLRLRRHRSPDLRGRREGERVPEFSIHAIVCIAFSTVVYAFVLRNRSETYLDREIPRRDSLVGMRT